MLSVNGTAGDFQLQHSSMVHQVVGANPVTDGKICTCVEIRRGKGDQLWF